MWIEYVSEDEATGIVAKIYKGTKRSWGGVDNIIKAHSLNTTALRALMTFYNGLMHGDCDLTLAQREMIAVTVSVLNKCNYWIRHHGEGLLRETNDPDWVEVMKQDYRQAELGETDRAMLDYVAKLTLAPSTVEEGDVIKLRQVGFGDKAILEINQITGFFAWCNRTVDGLGVELEDFWEKGLTNI